MATVTEAEPVAAGSATFRPFRVTIERYTRMVESGVLGPKDPVFLIVPPHLVAASRRIVPYW